MAETTRRRTLLMVPGLVSDADLYAEQRAGLADLVDVVVADVSRGASIEEMAQAALDVAPDGPFALAGLSMGGYVTLEVWRRATERVTALALLDTSARPDTPGRSAERREAVARARGEGLEPVLDALWPLEVAAAHVGDPALRSRFDAMARRQGVEVFARQTEAIIARPDSRDDLGRVKCPTLVLCGREDRITPLDGHEEMARGIDGADLVVLGRCGHLSSWERPDDVTAALRRWLAR